MREAMLICPIVGNDGAPLTRVIQAVQDQLVDAFGGCTSSLASGAWRDPDGRIVTEAVRQFVVACEPSLDADIALLNIAYEYGSRAKQQCVYIRYANGDVETVNTAHLWTLEKAA
jgi:hypothetical protein